MKVPYTMEELVPVVAELAQKLTGFESTSITYEKAEQLMEAVQYCIGSLEEDTQNEQSRSVWRTSQQLSAKEAYQLGYEGVKQCVKKSMEIYHEILPDFVWYHNRCLDYPVLKDLSGNMGVKAIYQYLTCIRLEQKFLKPFGCQRVERILDQYSGTYRGMIENLCWIVLADLLRQMPKSMGKTDMQTITKDKVTHMMSLEPVPAARIRSGEEACIGDMLKVEIQKNDLDEVGFGSS